MFNLFMFFVFIFDGLIIGALIFNLIKLIFGENAFSRFLRLILSIPAAIFYFYKTLSYSTNGSSMNIFIILSFGPIILILSLMFLGYIFCSKN